MKHLLIFLFIGLYTTLLAQPDLKQIEELIHKDNLNTCYYTSPLDSTITEKVFIEIESDQWKSRAVKTHDLIKEQGLEEELQSNSSSFIELMVSPPHQKLVRRRGNPGSPCPGIRTTTQFSNRNAMVMCLVEVPARYKTYPKQSILQDSLPVNTIKNEKIYVRELVKLGGVRIISAAEASQSNHYNIYEVFTGKWSDVNQLSYGHCPTTNKISVIQKKLVEYGYNIEVNGILDTDTRKALVDYQQKNSLPEGRLDIETLKALGVMN